MKEITEVGFQELCLKLTNLVYVAHALFSGLSPEWGDRSGGYFCLSDAVTGLPRFEPQSIGKVSAEKKEKYRRFAQEKAARLAHHPQHHSSYESRNPKRNQWGGAVQLFGNYIFSFSGLPELADEALMLILAEEYNRPSETTRSCAEYTASISHNPYWQPLREAVYSKEAMVRLS